MEDIELAVPNMTLPTPNCCIVVLNQQQEQNIEHNHNQSSEADEANQCKHKTKNCTVVENGLVVVRSSQAPPQEA